LDIFKLCFAAFSYNVLAFTADAVAFLEFSCVCLVHVCRTCSWGTLRWVTSSGFYSCI